MFNVHNMSSYNVPITFKSGSIVLRPGAYLDLDKYATRNFIKTSFEIQSYLSGVLRLVHDSEEKVATSVLTKMPKKVTQALKSAPTVVVPARIPPPQVIDLTDSVGDEGEDFEDAPPNAFLSQGQIEELPTVLPEDPIEKVLKGYNFTQNG